MSGNSDQQADIFVADITSVTPDGALRPCPNPNVTFELGYAVGELGWDRIILLFNQAFGQFPGDLPFDFAQHRAKPYRFAEADEPAAARNLLEQFLRVAVSAVLDKNPKRPVQVRGVSREKKEHDHDVKNMRWLMSKIHLPTLEGHILEMPYCISQRALWFWEDFNGVAANSLFSVYDQVLKENVEMLHFGWEKAVSHGEQYTDTPGGQHIFMNFGDMPLSAERQRIWGQINQARTEMKVALDKILERLRESYIEIDLRKTNRKAWKGYVDFKAEMQKKFGDDDEKSKVQKKNKS